MDDYSLMFPNGIRVRVPEQATLVVLGDPHGALAAVKQILEVEPVDAVLACVGDVIGYADGDDSSALAHFLRSKGAISVQGNHEEWCSPEGDLAFTRKRTDSRRIDSDALAWVKALPQRVDFLIGEEEDLLGSMVHSPRKPLWENVHEHNARALLSELRPSQFVLIGHSHCPRFIRIPREGKPSQEYFDFRKSPEASCALWSSQGALIVDAGSVAAPHFGFDKPVEKDFGTYAVVDLANEVVKLKRIVKRENKP